jgi:ComF family protein
MLDFLFPPECIICKAAGSDLCPSCLSGLEPAKPQNFEWITSLWNYRDPQVETLMRSLKNVPNKRMARILAPLLAEKVPAEQILIIPIPISASRFRERGYNQALLIAQPLARLLRQPIQSNVLFKARKTLKQGTTRSRKERIANMHHAFGVRHPERIIGKSILLVDDITTTGSTLQEAKNTLEANGAAKVFAITVAN